MKDKHLQSALLAYQDKKLAKALTLVKKIKVPSFAAKKLKLQLLYDLKQYQQAVLVGQDLLVLPLESKEVKEITFFMGVCLSNLDKKIQAIELLEFCVVADSSVNNAVAIYNLACLYFQESYYVKAQRLAVKLLSLVEYSTKAIVLLIKVSAALGDKQALKKYCDKLSLGVEKLTIEDLVILTEFYIGLKEWEKAQNYILLLEKVKNVDALALKVLLALSKKEFKIVDDLLTNEVLQQCKNPNLFYDKARALHELEIYESAFNTYQQAGLMRESNWKQERVIDELKVWHKYLDKRTNGKIPKCTVFDFEGAEYPSLAFVFGFPRSGTTLLDNILDTQNNITVLSEMGLVPKLVARAEKLTSSFPLDLHSLTQQQCKSLRAYYFELALEIAPSGEKSTLIIDKGPHHTAWLPFLQLLFPMAKFIASIRHPLDVCLSCFQQNFEFNSPNSFLTTIDKVVKRYLDVFTLLERYKNDLNIDVYAIRYEDIVLDFTQTLENLFKYLGIKPTIDYQHFNKHAAEKYINSASRGQTEQALYTTAVNKWQNYEQQLLPYKQQLDYFINLYGYDV